jgi:hypothetical protein
MRRYADVKVAYAAEVNEDGSANRLFTMVGHGTSVILAPLGHLSATTLDIDATWDITSKKGSFKTYNSTGDIVDIEPLGEFGASLPKLKDNNVSLQIAGHFLVASVHFVDDTGQPDDKETVVLLKDLLKHYPQTTDTISKQLSDALGPSYLYTFEIGEIETNSEIAQIKNSYSPYNIKMNEKYAEENFNEQNLFKSVKSIVGPYRPTKAHPEFQMYVADFLSFASKDDMPEAEDPIAVQVPLKPDNPEDNMPSLQSRKDFRQQVLHRVQKMPDLEKFTEEGHLDAIMKYSNMSKIELIEQCELDYQKYHDNNFTKFRLLMSCEAMSVLYGTTLTFDLRKRKRDE